MNDLGNYANDDIVISEYLSQLDEFEIELSAQEQTDLDELNKLLQNRTQQENLSTEIWGTIKKAAIDSIEQIIGLSDRGDWRPDQGAVITTLLISVKGLLRQKQTKNVMKCGKIDLTVMLLQLPSFVKTVLVSRLHMIHPKRLSKIQGETLMVHTIMTITTLLSMTGVTLVHTMRQTRAVI